MGNASENTTIIVKSGTYVENIVVNKSISITGEEVGNEGKPVITNDVVIPNFFTPLVTLDAKFCSFYGFKILYRPYVISIPMYIPQVLIKSNTTVFLNNDLVNNIGFSHSSLVSHIYVESTSNFIGLNTISGNGSSIGIESTESNFIFCNTISNCSLGLGIQNNSYVLGNTIKDNNMGIYMWNSSFNFLAGNKIVGNEYGLYIGDDESGYNYTSSSDFIIFNNITENTCGITLSNVSINNTRVRWNNIYNNKNYGLKVVNCTIDARFNWWGSFFGPSRGESNAFGDKIISENGKTKTLISMPVKNPLVDILYDFCQVVEIE